MFVKNSILLGCFSSLYLNGLMLLAQFFFFFFKLTTLALGIHFPAGFSANQTHLKKLIKVFKITRVTIM